MRVLHPDSVPFTEPGPIDYEMLSAGWLAAIGERLRSAPAGPCVLDGVPEPYRCWRDYASTAIAREAFARSGYRVRMRIEALQVSAV